MGSSEVKVGAFALGGAGILAGIITFMGAFSFGSRGYELHIDYPQVSGLMPGHVVRYAGVQVGTVREINVAPDKVQVVAQIDDNIKIPQGSVFTIAADGIMGEKFVHVVPPTKVGGGFIAADSTVKGVPGGGMEEFFSNSGDLMEKVENIAAAFENIFGDKEVQQSMKDGFRNMRDITENMNAFTKVMAESAVYNQEQINAIAIQMMQLSVRMNDTMSHVDSIMNGVDNNGQTGRNVALMVENLAKTTARVESVAAVLETVAKDPETQKSLKETIINVKETSDKANKLLGTFTDAKLSADAGYTMRGGDWRGNLGVTLSPRDDAYVYMGGYDIGEANKFDFIVGKRLGKGKAAVSMGAMQGEFGVGLDYNLSKDFKLYSQVYDFDDTKVRVGGEYKLTDTFSVYGETMDVKGSKHDAYAGVRTYF